MSTPRMRLLVINPNTTASMTEKIAIAARSVAAPDVDIVARNPDSGPASIQGPQDGLAALPGTFAEIRKGRDEGFDAIIIACFDDTGLLEARAISGVPTIGIGEAAFHSAMMLGDQFAVITTMAISVPVIERNLITYGLASKCLKVRASDVPVLDLEIPNSKARERISDQIAESLRHEKPNAIVLGCAGMADLTSILSEHHQVPVIDGVAAAVAMATGLVRISR